MSNVVELKPRLKKRNGLARQIGAALGPAQVILFSGVRYERWGEAEVKPIPTFSDCQPTETTGSRKRKSARR